MEPSRVKARFKKLHEWNTTEGITWGVDTNIGMKIVGVTGNLFRTYTDPGGTYTPTEWIFL